MRRRILCLLILSVFITTNLYAKDDPAVYIQNALASDDMEHTFSLLNEAVDKFPTDTGAYAILFNLYEAQAVDEERKGNAENAIKLLQKSRSLIDKYYKAIEALPEPLSEEHQEMDKMMKERLEKSKGWEQKLVETGKYLDVFREGNRLRDAEKYDEAIEQYNEAINIDDTFDHWVYFNRGVAYQKLEDYEKALKDLDKAIEIDETDPNFRTRRGTIKRQMGDYQAALADYNAAIEIDPNFGNAYLGRTEIYNRLGDKEAAAEALERAKELGAF